MPILEGLHLVTEANRHLSGLARRGRFVMFHRTGKVEIVGADDRFLYMRCHRAHHAEDYGRMIVAERDEQAYWLDGLTIVSGPESALAAAAATAAPDA